jgi:hypothetical protein
MRQKAAYTYSLPQSYITGPIRQHHKNDNSGSVVFILIKGCSIEKSKLFNIFTNHSHTAN